MTAVEWLIEQIKEYDFSDIKDTEKYIFKMSTFVLSEKIEQAKQMEKEKILDDLIGFQIYLNNKGLITNHDWDFEKMSKLYIKKEYGKK